MEQKQLQYYNKFSYVIHLHKKITSDLIIKRNTVILLKNYVIYNMIVVHVFTLYLTWFQQIKS